MATQAEGSNCWGRQHQPQNGLLSARWPQAGILQELRLTALLCRCYVLLAPLRCQGSRMSRECQPLTLPLWGGAGFWGNEKVARHSRGRGLWSWITQGILGRWPLQPEQDNVFTRGWKGGSGFMHEFPSTHDFLRGGTHGMTPSSAQAKSPQVEGPPYTTLHSWGPSSPLHCPHAPPPMHAAPDPQPSAPPGMSVPAQPSTQGHTHSAEEVGAGPGLIEPPAPQLGSSAPLPCRESLSQ